MELKQITLQKAREDVMNVRAESQAYGGLKASQIQEQRMRDAEAIRKESMKSGKMIRK